MKRTDARDKADVPQSHLKVPITLNCVQTASCLYDVNWRNDALIKFSFAINVTRRPNAPIFHYVRVFFIYFVIGLATTNLASANRISVKFCTGNNLSRTDADVIVKEQTAAPQAQG